MIFIGMWDKIVRFFRKIKNEKEFHATCWNNSSTSQISTPMYWIIHSPLTNKDYNQKINMVTFIKVFFLKYLRKCIHLIDVPIR